jgi:CheY-like chemotaxis protein
LPSRPEVHTANSAARAFALLESESFALMITDLRMPKMDGFQVLTGVRQRFPSLRTIVLTSLVDEQYRARAYAMDIDLYTEKPGTPGEIKLFIQCVESLLNRGAGGGFRGVQSKSLMDLIQLECLSQNSSVLRITNGSLEAKIWIQGGDVIDAHLKDLGGEEAFKSIFAWRSGNFEILPGEPGRKRTIFTSHQGLLLDTAQMLDEVGTTSVEEGLDDAVSRPSPALAPLARVGGVESLLIVNAENAREFEAWGVENAERFAEWTQHLAREWRTLGERLNAGTLDGIETLGSTRHLALLSRDGRELLAGLDRTLSAKQVREAVKDIAARWEP